MPKTSLLALLLLLSLLSCKKEGPGAGPASPALPATDDRRTILLKEVSESGMPAPYFRFRYDSAGYATHINFADGFHIYEVSYADRRVAKLHNTQSGTDLLYEYSDGLVRTIRQADPAGGGTSTHVLAYNNARQLQSIHWYRRAPGASDSSLERSVTFAWGADGNLASWSDLRPVNGNLTLLRTFTYSDYDNGTNVDDFHLFKDFFEDFLFLPSVRFQKSNPRRVDITGPVNDFVIEYTYDYANGRPVARRGRMRQTRGGGVGQELLLTTSYSYY